MLVSRSARVERSASRYIIMYFRSLICGSLCAVVHGLVISAAPGDGSRQSAEGVATPPPPVHPTTASTGPHNRAGIAACSYIRAKPHGKNQSAPLASPPLLAYIPSRSSVCIPTAYTEAIGHMLRPTSYRSIYVNPLPTVYFLFLQNFNSLIRL